MTRMITNFASDHLMRIARSRGFDVNSTRCPHCNSGLQVRVVPATNQTVVYCTRCGANATLPVLRDDGREFHEQFVPGVTGRPRPTSTYRVRMDAAGKIVGVEKVK